jgi:hypothetical protein
MAMTQLIQAAPVDVQNIEHVARSSLFADEAQVNESTVYTTHDIINKAQWAT